MFTYRDMLFNCSFLLYIFFTLLGCLAGAVLTHSPLTAATQVRYPASACEMVTCLLYISSETLTILVDYGVDICYNANQEKTKKT